MECPENVRLWIERFREAYAAVNGKEMAARLSASYNRGWIKLELAPTNPAYWTGPDWYKNVHLRELAQMTKNLQQQAAYARSQAAIDAGPEVVKTGPLEVSVFTNGDPEVFYCRYVRIACRHGIFRIKLNSDLGLRISAEDGSLRIIPQAANAVLLKEEVTR